MTHDEFEGLYGRTVGDRVVVRPRQSGSGTWLKVCAAAVIVGLIAMLVAGCVNTEAKSLAFGPFNPGGPLPTAMYLNKYRCGSKQTANESWLRLEFSWVNMADRSPEFIAMGLSEWRQSHPWPQ
jgi:hypothetical protein